MIQSATPGNGKWVSYAGGGYNGYSLAEYAGGAGSL